MLFNHTDINTFRSDLEGHARLVLRHRQESAVDLKILATLNMSVYVLATRFLEGSVKHIAHSQCLLRGDTEEELQGTIERFKRFNNPEYPNIKQLFQELFGYDITAGMSDGYYEARDITFVNQIVKNRHENVHAKHDSTTWYNINRKTIDNFSREYIGMLKILKFIDSITFDRSTSSFTYIPYEMSIFPSEDYIRTLA